MGADLHQKPGDHKNKENGLTNRKFESAQSLAKLIGVRSLQYKPLHED